MALMRARRIAASADRNDFTMVPSHRDSRDTVPQPAISPI
jgi:hypothetical protein